MAEKPKQQFGTRQPAVVPPPSPPAKRSGHVALLVMGTIAVGSTAFMLMPKENCQPNSPGMAPSSAECQARSSSSSHGGSGGSSRYYGGSSSSQSGTTESSGVKRGGFGSFAHSFSSHFSGGG